MQASYMADIVKQCSKVQNLRLAAASGPTSELAAAVQSRQYLRRLDMARVSIFHANSTPLSGNITSLQLDSDDKILPIQVLDLLSACEATLEAFFLSNSGKEDATFDPLILRTRTDLTMPKLRKFAMVAVSFMNIDFLRALIHFEALVGLVIQFCLITGEELATVLGEKTFKGLQMLHYGSASVFFTEPTEEEKAGMEASVEAVRKSCEDREIQIVGFDEIGRL